MFNRNARIAAAVAALSTMLGQAHADLPAAVSTGISSAGADGLTIVGLLAAAGASVFLISKVLKKFGVSL
jgi:hypothetical protein